MPYGISYPMAYIPIMVMICIIGITIEHRRITKSLVITMIGVISVVVALSFWRGRVFCGYIIPLSSIFVLSVLGIYSKIEKCGWERVILILCIIGFLIQFFLFSEERRLVSSIGDPNFAGYIALTLFIFSVYRGYNVGILLGVLLIFVLLSRTYMFSLLIFAVTYLFRDKVYRLIEKVRLNSFIAIFTVTNVAVLVLSLFLVSQLEFGEVTDQQGEGSRLFRVTDSSLYVRLYQNARVFEMLWQGEADAWIGLWERVQQDYIIKSSRLKGQPPHNSLFHAVIVYGFIFTVVYVLSISVIVDRWLNSRSVPIFFAFSAYAANLHALLVNWWIIAFAVLLLVANGGISNELEDNQVQRNQVLDA